jgi:hypothetical protein
MCNLLWLERGVKFEKMVKNNKQKKNGKRMLRRPAAFGAISSINTAPVSIGNSVRGTRPRISQTVDGARIVGRDFAYALSGTGSAVTNWELIGGMPISPSVLPSSILRNYCQMFQKFKVNSVAVHYITSSATSQTGDVLFYYERDRYAPMCDYSSSSFLPFILSDPNSLIGPQWMNHSVVVKPTADWKSTLYGNQDDINEDSTGTLFLFSKTSSVSSPGYMLIDYDISFRELSVNPRAGSLPVARGQSSFVCFTYSTGWSAGATAQFDSVTTGKTITNVTSQPPTGVASGDIYKAVFQITSSTLVNAAWTGTPTPTVSNLLRYADNLAITLDDGFTCYVLYDATSGNWVPYATLEGAVCGIKALEFATTEVLPTINICAELQLVRNVDTFTQSAY